MAIAYTYKVNSARVAAQGDLVDVIKEVEVTVTGKDGAANFDLPTTVQLGDADPENFTSFASLTEAQIVSWLESNPLLDPTRMHIAFVVEKEKAKLAMENKPLPWQPAPEPAAPPLPVETPPVE